jgi:excisionase family DNA binding protein
MRPSSTLTLQQAAGRIGVHEQTLRKYIRAGLLRAFKTPSVSKFGGRFRIAEADLEKFRARHMTTTAPIAAPSIESEQTVAARPGCTQKISQGHERRENLF